MFYFKSIKLLFSRFSTQVALAQKHAYMESRIIKIIVYWLVSYLVPFVNAKHLIKLHLFTPIVAEHND